MCLGLYSGDEPGLFLVIPLLLCVRVIVSGFTLCRLLMLLQLGLEHLQAGDLTCVPSLWKDIPLLALLASPLHLRK